MKRREFLKNSLYLSGLSLLPAWSMDLMAQTPPKHLVYIFLRGGADALSMLSPPSATMQSLRPNLNVTGALPFATNLSLHPLFAPFVNDSQIMSSLNFILHCGSVNDTRSHFVQQALIEAGSSTQSGSTGFLARASLANSKLAIGMGNGTPLSLKGCNPAMLNDPGDLSPTTGFGVYGTNWTRAQRMGLYQKSATENGNVLIDSVARATQSLYDSIYQSLQVKGELSGATLIGRSGYINSAFGKSLAYAGAYIGSGPAPMFVAVDANHAWDTHFGQYTNDKNQLSGFAFKLNDLIQNLSAFKRDLVARGKWSNTVVVIMSEFGRTVRENSSQGSDHGRGGLMMLMGGPVRRFSDTRNKGVRSWTIPATTDSSTALDVTHDYRLVLAEILQKHLGISQTAVINDIFLNQISAAGYLNVLV